MKNVWSWQDAILASKMQAPTKLILLTLATYMNGRGNHSAWPSQKTIAGETSLSKRSVIDHIEKAVAAGFIVKKKREEQGSLWDANEYFATFPDGVKLLHPTDVAWGEAAAPDGVQEMHTNRPSELTSKKEAKASKKKTENYGSDFILFWAAFPKLRAGSREKAFEQFEKAAARAGTTAILAGVAAYAQSEEVARGFAKGAAAWLADDRWTSDYTAHAGLTQTENPTMQAHMPKTMTPEEIKREKRRRAEAAMGA